MPRITHQAGFTIVEIAVVMVIAGLIFGSVLKNQELMAAASTRRLAGDFRAIAAALQSYQDSYHALPGDDRAADRHVAGSVATTPTGATGNQRIDGDWNSLMPSDESYLCWQHLRLARLLGGATELPNSPTTMETFLLRNGVEGRLGITSDPVHTGTVWPANYVVCTAGIPGRIVRRLELILDDGNTLTGSLRTLCEGECSTGPGVGVMVTNEGESYTVCAAN